MSNSNSPIFLSKTRALLFDLDGTIIDNMSYHYAAWRELLLELGHDWTMEKIRAEIWGKNQEIFERIFPGRFTYEEATNLTYKKELHYIELYRPHVQMLPGLENFLIAARKAGIKLAVATAAPRVCVDFATEALKLNDYFDCIVHAEMVKRSKPDPETYLTAASSLGAEPINCIVFEDAPVGVRSAEAAKMESFVLLTTHEREEFTEFKLVKGFVRDFTGFSVVG